MTKYLIFIFVYLLLNCAKSQTQWEGAFLEIDLYQLNQNTDSLNCLQLQKLKNEITKINYSQLKRAWALADSLSQIEFPCYEFDAEIVCVAEYNPTSYEEGCSVMYTSFDLLCVNSKIILVKKRRSGVLPSGGSGAVYCNEDLIRH